MSNRLAGLLAVVGTDTGVGKTVVGAGLIHGLRRAGLRVVAFKPVETGLVDGHLEGDLADWERLAAESGQDPRSCLGDSYALPASPLAAARQADRPVDLPRLHRQLQELRARADLVLVEGAGGLCVPLAESTLWADQLQCWEPDVLVVGRLGLGTLNHTLLTLAELRRRGLQVVGTLLNTLASPGPESLQTPGLISEFGGSRVCAVIPAGCHSPGDVARELRDCGLLDRLTSRYRTD